MAATPNAPKILALTLLTIWLILINSLIAHGDGVS